MIALTADLLFRYRLRFLMARVGAPGAFRRWCWPPRQTKKEEVRRKKFEQILSCVPAFLIQVLGSPRISRFSVFYGDVRSNRDANRGRFFFWENVNASVEGERTFAVRIVRQPHFLQTFPGESNLAIRRRALG